MRRVRQKGPKGQPSTTTASQVSTQTIAPLDDGSVTLAMVQAWIPLGLRAVEDALQQEVRSLAGVRYAHDDGHPDVARWGSQPGSVFLADQKLPIEVPRVCDVARHREVPLSTYQQLQTPRSADVGLFRRVLGGISCREYEAAGEAVPEAFALAKSSVSRRFIRSSARSLRQLQERRHNEPHCRTRSSHASEIAASKAPNQPSIEG